tara:strand:- start:339 stop:1403 length:1065 start_codon:yes stop_codon:yes gene_type:complete
MNNGKQKKFLIRDKRLSKDFSQITFSGYKKSEVKKNLIKEILAGKIEDSCFWSCEYICAGHYAELWEIFILIASKHIHMANPKLSIYLYMRYGTFRNKITSSNITNILSLRNDLELRKMFCEVVCILCFSKKRHALSRVKIEPAELDVTNYPDRLKATRKDLAKRFVKRHDSRQLYIALNEFVYHLSPESKNTLMACYWVEWALRYERMLKMKDKEGKKKKESFVPLKNILQCSKRDFAPVDPKHRNDYIWMYWQIIIYYSNFPNNQIIRKIVQNLFEIFCIRYSPGSKTKRIFIIYNAISLLTDYIDPNIDVVSKGEIIDKVKSKINLMYGEIKKNEIVDDRRSILFMDFENK